MAADMHFETSLSRSRFVSFRAPNSLTLILAKHFKIKKVRVETTAILAIRCHLKPPYLAFLKFLATVHYRFKSD